MKPILFFFYFLFLFSQTMAQLPEKSVFHANRSPNSHWLTYQDNHRALYRVITNEAFSQLDSRSEYVSTLNTPEDWKIYQEKIKTSLGQSLEKFTRTPLNARVTGTIEQENYKIEKVIFESHPQFYVTAALFLPKQRQNPAPAVIYCCGHTELGFRSETYQHVILNLVNKGFIVLAFDPLGQGERLQYADKETGQSKIGGSTKEHSYAGVQTLLTGTSLTDYFIWDGIRTIDYLESRPEVDMNRIGITGRSGGGTQTAMIAACDDRIYAAAPENYITSFKRLLQSIGPQDAEQNPWFAIAKGLDHADFLHSHAPKPALMITTTHDFFSIQGARETFAEVKRSFSALGHPDNLQMVEDAGGHQSTKNNREALYAFFQKHLNLPGEPIDSEVSTFPVEQLWVTPTGQLSTSYPGETVFSLNQKYYSAMHTKEISRNKQQEIHSGMNLKRNVAAAVFTGRFKENDMDVEKYFLENNRKDYALPVYILSTDNSRHDKLMVWFHPGGKGMVLTEQLANKALRAGFSIVAVDLPGSGELHDPEFSGDGIIQGIPFNYTFGANLVGKSIPGIQAEAIDLLMQFINNDDRFKGAARFAIVQGTAASAFLHASTPKNEFTKAAFYKFPKPMAAMIEEEFYNPEVAFAAIPGSLPENDLPDLAQKLSDEGTAILIINQDVPFRSQTQNEHEEIINFFNE